MKYNITTLKKEIPENIRLEVYKEALKRIEFTNDQGFCLGLPKIMLNIGEDNYLGDTIDSETNERMMWFDTKIAFPELTQKVIIMIGECETDLEGFKMRKKLLEEWISTLEKR